MMQIKICTGCGWLNTKPLGENMYGKPYSACCPDSSYKEITAVEWLFIMLKDSSKELFEQAKQMEKKQMIDAWDNGCEYDGIIDSAEQYYNETYGNTNSN